MEITEKQINDFVEENDMTPLGGDMFEDAGGHVWHEANIMDEIEEARKRHHAKVLRKHSNLLKRIKKNKNAWQAFNPVV